MFVSTVNTNLPHRYSLSERKQTLMANVLMNYKLPRGYFPTSDFLPAIPSMNNRNSQPRIFSKIQDNLNCSTFFKMFILERTEHE